MNINIYYHTYLDDNYLWSQLLLEKFKVMEDSGLMQKTNKIHITAITQNDPRVGMFHNLCGLYNVPVEIEFIQNQYNNDIAMMEDLRNIFGNVVKNVGEDYTHKKMQEACKKEDQIILYLHAKGITSILNNLTVPGLVSKYRNRYYWRMFMYNVMTDWKECVDALQSEYDTAGIDYSELPSPHYRGNFFWSKSDHIKTLPDPMTRDWWAELKREKNHEWLNKVCDRFGSELWLCSKKGTRSFNSRTNNGDYIDNDI
jgi:hypothetical protein